MRILILLTLSFLTLPYWVQAQSENPFGTSKERAKLQTEKMKTALPLREEQIDKIYALNLKYAEIMQKEVLDQGASQWTMYTKGSAINKQKEKELKPLLSDSQYKNYEKLKAEMRKQMLSGEKPKSLNDLK